MGCVYKYIVDKMKRKKILAITIIILLVAVIYVVAQMNEFGCCRSFCFKTAEDLCPGEWGSSDCGSSYCTLGCCKDPQNIYHSEYSKGECERKGGRFTSGHCPGVVPCNSTDKE